MEEKKPTYVQWHEQGGRKRFEAGVENLTRDQLVTWTLRILFGANRGEIGPGWKAERLEPILARVGVAEKPTDAATANPKAHECPTCGAKVGSWCKRPSGHSGPFVQFHAARPVPNCQQPLAGIRELMEVT